MRSLQSDDSLIEPVVLVGSNSIPGGVGAPWNAVPGIKVGKEGVPFQFHK